MSLLRKVSWLFVLAIAFSTIAVPVVRAQTTSITNLQAPSTAMVGTDVTVVVAATYNLGSNGYAVSVGIFDRDAWWAAGTAQSSQNTCHIYPNEALCGYIPKSASGSDVVTFHLQFSSVKTYRLRAAVELYYSNAQLISGASTFQDFSITVQSTSQASTPVTSITNPQIPISTTSQPAYDTPQLWLAFAIIAALAVLGALIMYLRRGKKLKTTVAKTVDSTTKKAT